MVEPSPLTAFSHVQLRVGDLERSETWYATVLGMTRLVDGPQYVALRHPPSGVVVVLTEAPVVGGPSDGALDHLAFAVPDGPTLSSWADRLRDKGIEHGVVDELGKPSLTLTDPDGTRIELVAPPGSWSGEGLEPVG